MNHNSRKGARVINWLDPVQSELVLKTRVALGAVLVFFTVTISIAGVFAWQSNARTLAPSGILVCEAPLDPSFDSAFGSIADQRGRLAELLSNSSDPDRQALAIARGISNNNPDAAAFGSLLALSDRAPESMFAALLSLRGCSAFADNPGCNNTLIERTIALEGDNATVPALVAGLRYAQGDEFGAAAALRAAGLAPRFDDNVSRLTATLLATVSPVSDAEAPLVLPLLLTESVQLMSLNYDSLRPLLSMCSTSVRDNPMLANTCRVFAQRLIGSSRTLIGTQLGYALLGVTLSANGDASGAQRTESEGQAVLARVRDDVRIRDATRLMDYDTDLMRTWLDTLVARGEEAAMYTVAEEAMRRSSTPDYNPCPSVLLSNLGYRFRRALSL